MRVRIEEELVRTGTGRRPSKTGEVRAVVLDPFPRSNGESACGESVGEGRPRTPESPTADGYTSGMDRRPRNGFLG